MDMLDLKRIGLTDGEVKIYCALLELGETTRSRLGKRSGISPSKIYDVISRLSEKGLVSSVKKHGITHFSPASPRRLEDFLDRKAEALAEEKGIIGRMMPSLLELHKKIEEDTDVEAYYGWKGIGAVFRDLEESMGPGDESLVFGASVGRDPEQADLFFRMHQQRIEKRGFKVRIIFNEDVRGRPDRYRYYLKHRKHRIRFLHYQTLTEMYIYRGSVLFLMLLAKPIAIRIKSAEAVDSFSKFFQTIWKEASDA